MAEQIPLTPGVRYRITLNDCCILIPEVWTPRSSATILDDIKRAVASINAAPAYKHDCQAQGCANE